MYDAVALFLKYKHIDGCSYFEMIAFFKDGYIALFYIKTSRLVTLAVTFIFCRKMPL